MILALLVLIFFNDEGYEISSSSTQIPLVNRVWMKKGNEQFIPVPLERECQKKAVNFTPKERTLHREECD